ncbi:MAG: LysE family transporter [Thermoanaerobaculia bacterium]
MIAAITAALIYGLSGGLTPGPLLMLVLTQTMKHGTREGIRTSLAPLLTDGPLIVIVLLSLEFLSAMGKVLGVIGALGALYLLYLAVETWSSRPPDPTRGAGDQPRSLMRGVLVNLLNPNPYIFWFTVGAATLTRAWRSGTAATVAFVVVFFVCLVGSKIAMAVIAGRSREHLGGRWYVPTMRLLAVLLVAMAALTARDAWRLLTA